MASSLGAGIAGSSADPEALYTKQNCIGPSPPPIQSISTSLMHGQEVEVLARSTKGRESRSA